MKVFYSPYTLHPLKRSNRLSSLEEKHGVFLKAVLKDNVMFADYFPHLPLGDRHRDQFLSEFKFQENEYDKKVFHLLLKDPGFQKLKPKTFTNHQLWTGTESLEAPVVKYKLMHPKDRTFHITLEKGHRLRLDGNALFTKSEYEAFIKDIPEKYHVQIEYIEDPLSDSDWKGLNLPAASDFIEGSDFDYYIYKPNCEFYPDLEKKIIFSAYLGSSFGNWHSYCELSEKADLNLTHGITSQGFYEEERHFLSGSYQDGFVAQMDLVHKLYQEVYDQEWKVLCSM